MATETIGDYQLHLIAHELSDGRWEPYLKIDKFDVERQDFICVLEKYRVTESPLEDYEIAIEAARQAGNNFILQKKL
jgi:hypothetical protein